MLLFSSNTCTVNGITVFPDHADPNQFWYLPGPVGLATLPDSTEPQFLLIEYAPDVASSGVKGVGFLNVTVALKLSDTDRAQVMNQVRMQFPDATNPNLAPVSFDDGTVQIVALDMQGSGGTTANLPPGAFEAVQHILGATSPELFGENDALFALTLSADGASILEAAFQDKLAPVGVIYSMKFTGARPAIDVKITADLKRAYESFSVGLTGSAYFVSAGIDATFEKLRQDGVIQVQVVNLTTDATNADKEQWALNLFKDDIMAQWFTPSLSPTTEAAADASSLNLPTKPAGPTTPAKPAGGTSTPAGGGMLPKGSTTAGAMSGANPSGSTMQTPAKPVAAATGTTPATPAATGATPAAAATIGLPGATVSIPGPSAAAPAVPAAVPGAPATAPGAIPKIPAVPGAPALPGGAAGTAAAASSAASPFGVALRLKFVSQDELKTVEIEYNRMDAVQRVYAPQGYFGLMLGSMDPVDQSKLFLKVDGTDPFFSQFTVTVNAPHDFAGIGLLAAHVAIDYGDPSNPAALKHGEFLFDPAHTAQQVWQVFQGLITSTQYSYTVDYKFDPESGWQGEQTAYTQPAVITEDRVLNLDPSDFLSFLNVMVSPGNINVPLVERIEVALQYTSSSGWNVNNTIVVLPGAQPQYWKLRLTDKTQNSYSYTTTCYLQDGTSFKNGPITSSASAVIINDPFVGALDLMFQPALSPTLAMAIVELSYRDNANNYGYKTSFQIPASATQPTLIHIPLIDRTQNQFQYRITTLTSTNQQSQGAYITTSDTLVLVGTS